MYSFRVFAARRDRTGAKDHPPHIQPPSPRTGMDGGALGPGRLWGTCPAPDPGGIGTHAAGMSDRESPQQVGPFGPHRALCRIAERQRECPQAGRLLANLPAARHGIKSTPAREVSPDRKPGLSAHIEPSARAHQAEGAGCISPPAALAAVGLPGCRRAGLKYVQSPLILQRGRLSRPCRRRSLSAAALRGRHGIRHPSCKPDWVRRTRTGRQPAAAPLRAASGGRSAPLVPGFLSRAVPACSPGSWCRALRRPGTRADPGGRYAGTVFHPTHSPSPPCAWTDGKK